MSSRFGIEIKFNQSSKSPRSKSVNINTRSQAPTHSFDKYQQRHRVQLYFSVKNASHVRYKILLYDCAPELVEGVHKQTKKSKFPPLSMNQKIEFVALRATQRWSTLAEIPAKCKRLLKMQSAFKKRSRLRFCLCPQLLQAFVAE